VEPMNAKLPLRVT